MARDDTLACAKWHRSPRLYPTAGWLYSHWDGGCFVLTARCGRPWMVRLDGLRNLHDAGCVVACDSTMHAWRLH